MKKTLQTLAVAGITATTLQGCAEKNIAPITPNKQIIQKVSPTNNTVTNIKEGIANIITSNKDSDTNTVICSNNENSSIEIGGVRITCEDNTKKK